MLGSFEIRRKKSLVKDFNETTNNGFYRSSKTEHLSDSNYEGSTFLIVERSSIVGHDRQWLFICIETYSTWIGIVDKDSLIVCYTRHLIRDPFQCCHVHSVPWRYASGQFRNGTSGCTSTNAISSCRGTSLLRKITKCLLRRSFSSTVNWSRGVVHCHDFERTTRFSQVL